MQPEQKQVLNREEINTVRRLVNNHRKDSYQLHQLFNLLDRTCLGAEFFEPFKTNNIKTSQIEMLCSFFKYDFFSKGQTLCMTNTIDDDYYFYVLSGEMGLSAFGNFDKSLLPQIPPADNEEAKHLRSLLKNLSKIQGTSFEANSHHLLARNQRKNVQNTGEKEPAGKASFFGTKKSMLLFGKLPTTFDSFKSSNANPDVSPTEINDNFESKNKIALQPREISSQINILTEVINRKKQNKKTFGQDSLRKKSVFMKSETVNSSDKIIKKLKQSNFFESRTNNDRKLLESFNGSYLNDQDPISDPYLLQIQKSYGTLLQTMSQNTLISSDSLKTFGASKYTIFALRNTELVRINKIKIRRFMAELFLEKFAKIRQLFSKVLGINLASFSSRLEQMAVNAKVCLSEGQNDQKSSAFRTWRRHAVDRCHQARIAAVGAIF